MGVKLPGLGALGGHWRAAMADVLPQAAGDGLVLDLRSEGYADLGPAPRRPDSVFVRVVSEDDQGRRRALNHFNKKSKGGLVRTLACTRPRVKSAGSLLSWAGEQGILLRRTADAGVLELVVAE